MPAWSHEAEARLLVAILECHDFKCDNEKLAARMEGFTANAIRQHIQKLKNNVKGKTGNHGRSTGTTSTTTATQEKKKGGAVAKKGSHDGGSQPQEDPERIKGGRGMKKRLADGRVKTEAQAASSEDDEATEAGAGKGGSRGGGSGGGSRKRTKTQAGEVQLQLQPAQQVESSVKGSGSDDDEAAYLAFEEDLLAQLSRAASPV